MTGRAAQVSIHGFLPVLEAMSGDLLEAPADSVSTSDGTVRLDFDGAQIQTLILRPADLATERVSPALLEQEPTVLPEYARYWLHNRGVAPTGAHPVSVHLHGASSLTGATTVRCVVSSDLTKDSARGEVTLVVPAGWSVEPQAVPYDLPPGGHQSVDVTVNPPAGTGAGCYLVTAQTVGPNGSILQDVLAMTTESASPRFLGADLAVDALRLAPGESHDLTVQLTNHAHGTLVTEVQTLTPYGTWEAVPRWSELVAVPGPGTVEHTVTITIPGSARAGRWWLLVKVIGGGQIVYTPAVPLTILPTAAGAR